MSLHRVLRSAALVLALATAACYNPNRVLSPDDVLAIEASPATIPANGFSVSKITVRVATTTRRDLTFSFTKSDGGTLSVPTSQTSGPDGSGEISVFLTSDTTSRTVLVTVDVKSGTTIVASRSVTVTFEPPAAASVIKLTATPAQVEADGTAPIELRAQINAGVATRTVSFTTTNGTFTPNANPPVRDLPNRPTDADGVAVAQLYASGQAGTAVVTASAGGFSDSQTVVFTPLTLRLSLSSASVDADGASTIELRAETPKGATRLVSFTTTNGSFEPGTSNRSAPNRPTNVDGIAVAQLYAPNSIGSAIVTATSSGFSDSQTVTFAAAAPDFISLAASPLSVRAIDTNSTTLTATLSRVVGVPSVNTLVEFVVVSDVTGVGFGRFEEVTRSDGEGKATGRFVPGSAAPPGLATLTARVPGTGLSAQVKITIAP
jgi:hypothetical protein